MADDLGAVRRTLRPTGDRQTPETVAQPGAGTTQDVPEGKETNPPLSTRERLAELIAATDRHMTPEDFAEPRLAARAHATAILAAGWRAPRPDHEAALADLRTKLAEEPDSILFAGPECDMEAYAALPPCAACEGCGQDTHGTVFEAPLAVHFAGPPCDVGQRKRQLCMWCGHVLIDVPAEAPLAPHLPWPAGSVVQIEDGYASQLPYPEGDALPPGCCALPDDEEPRGYGERVCRRCDVQAAFCPCTKPDVADESSAEHCGKHVPGTSSNRCLLRSGHTGDHSDEFEVPTCTCEPDRCHRLDVNGQCQHCARLGPGQGGCPAANGRAWTLGDHPADRPPDPGPDEAQETRATDWPAEEADHG